MFPPRAPRHNALLLTAMAALVAALPAAAVEPTLVGGRGQPVLLVLGPEADEGLYGWEGKGPRPRGGLAPYLARRGFQVWITTHDDLAAAIDHVRTASGAGQISLVGHGLGGTACYRHLATAGTTEGVAQLVTLGAPYRWSTRSPLLDEVLGELGDPDTARYSQLAGTETRTTPGDLFAVSLSGLPVRRGPELLARAREAGAVTRRAALDDLPAWVAGASPLPTLEGRALLLCGEIDRIAPCEEAWRARDALGPNAAIHKLGYMNLDRLDFGHLDLILTPEARRRVFPVVARFLRAGSNP